MRQLTPAECVVLLLQDLRPELVDVSCRTLVEQGQRFAAMLWRDVEGRNVPALCKTKAVRT